MTMLEALILVNAIALVVSVFVLSRLATRIGQAMDDVGLAARRISELTPAAQALIETSHDEIVALRSLTRTTAAVAEDVRAVTGQASMVTSHVLRGFESEVFDRYRAVFAGARAGIDMLRRFRGGNGSHGSTSTEVEEFD